MERQVFFINEGQRLYGMVHSSEGEGIRPGVVLYHGFTGHKMETHCIFVKLARELAAAGLHVLRFDFRGSGESEGRFEDMTLDSEISDARAALEIGRAHV